MRGDANVAFAQAYDNILLPQMLVVLRCFLRAACRKTSIRAAPRSIQRAGRHKAVLREAVEHEFDQFLVMRRNQLWSHAHHKIHGDVHGHQIEIEIAGPLRRIPPLRVCRRLGVFEVQRREIVRARHRHPIKRSRPHQPEMLALGPEESGAERTQQPLVASGHQKVGTELIDIHGYCPAALADVQQ